MIDNLKKILGVSSLSNINTLVESAKQAEAEKDWSLAAELYEKARDTEPKEANWSYRLGLSLERAKRFQESISAYQRAIELKPKHEWWYRLGISAEGAKDFVLVRKAHKESLKLKNNSDPLLLKLLEASPVGINSRFKLLEYLRGKLPDLQKRVAENASIQSGEPNIFTYWDSGIEQAPVVVKACIREMMNKHKPGKVSVIDAKNWKYYVDLPDHVLQKVPTNKAHFSDILRVALLSKYGGIWADATCMPSKDIGSIFNEITQSGFFSYNYSTARISNWFLCTSGDNYIAKIMFEAMCDYWKDYNYALHYYFFHHIFEILYYLDERFHTIWDQSKKASSKEPHAIQKMMLTDFDDTSFMNAYSESAVHKLTYKFDESLLRSSTVLAHVVRGFS
nr:capsular polysaccharide synthesis protein [Rahnella aquatilis]